MDFTSTTCERQQSGGAGLQQESSPAPTSADAAVFDGHLRAIANSGARVLTSPTDPVGAPSEPVLLTQVSGHEYTPASQGAGGGAMLGASALQPGRSTWAFVGRSGEPLYSEDAPLVEGLRAALIKGGFKQRTAKSHVESLLRLGRWLLKNNKPGIAERLYDDTLDSDAAEFKKAGERGILTALGHLRASQAPASVALVASRANPSADDADLIKEYKSTIIQKRKKEAATAYKYATALSNFSEYLRNNSKPGIAARLNNQSLDEDLRCYEATPRHHPKIGAALAHLRKSLVGGGAIELDHHTPTVPDTEDVALMDAIRLADAAAQDSALQRTVSWPEILPAQGQDQDLTSSIMDEPSPSSYLALQPGQVGRSADPIYSEDEPLILGLKEALLRGGAAESTARSNVDSLLGFDRWLFANDKPGIADRLDDESLDKDIEEFIAKRGATNARTALAHLRTSQAAGGVAPVAGRPDLNPYPEDAALIKRYKEQATTADASSTARSYASLITDFSHYLRENDKQSIAARLDDGALDEDESLNEDIKLYRQSGGYRAIGAALDHLRSGARKLGPSPFYAEDAPLISGLEDALVDAKFEKITAQTNVRILRRFSRWLLANEKPAIASRLYDKSLDLDAAMFDKGRKRRTLTALDHLRASQSADGIAPNTARVRTVATAFYSEDTQLISGLEKALVAARYQEASAQATGRHLRKLSQWLFANDKPAIAARIGEESLDKDVEAFKESGGEQQVFAALAHLRASQSAGGIAPRTGRVDLSPYPEDADLIKDYKVAESKPTARNYAPILTGFSDYLRQNNKQGIAARLSDKSLDKDVEAYRSSGGHAKTGAALAHLLKSPAGVRAIELRRHFVPVADPEDRLLPDQMRVADAAARHNASAGGGSSPVGRPLEDYDEDLRDLLTMMEGADTFSPLEPIARHHRASASGEPLGPLNWPYKSPVAADEVMDVLDWSELRPGNDVLINDDNDTGEPRATKRQRIQNDPEDVFIEGQLSRINDSGARALVQPPADPLGASRWQAQSGHEHDPAPHALARHVGDAAGQPQGVVSWPLLLPEAYDQDVLWRMVEDRPPWSGLVSSEQAQEVGKAGRQEPAGSTSTWSLQMPSNFDWSMWPNRETAPSSSVRARSSDIDWPSWASVDSLPHELRDDAHFAPVRTSSDAQIGAVDRADALPGRRGLVLGAMEWLGDEHITRDNALLQEELQKDNPDLASRTRFVQPAQAHLLRLTKNKRDLLETRLGIVNDQDGNDTANFLFVPVNDGSVRGGGAHWSLLFIDRRDRERSVAYHYDSIGTTNGAIAAELAARLGARLQPARIPEQQNDYDCGVFVVDGTRALVGRLAQGERPQHDPLHLDNLVADRQALRNRLRG